MTNVPRNRLNTWLSTRVWVWIAALVLSVVLLGVALLVIVGRVADNASKLSELRYRSCITDAELNFKIAEGAVVEAAFTQNREAVARLLPAYSTSLELLRHVQTDCRTKFPEGP